MEAVARVPPPEHTTFILPVDRSPRGGGNGLQEQIGELLRLPHRV